MRAFTHNVPTLASVGVVWYQDMQIIQVGLLEREVRSHDDDRSQGPMRELECQVVGRNEVLLHIHIHL